MAIYQKGVYYLGIKIFNSLSSAIKNFSNKPKIFKATLKNFYVQLPFIHQMNTFNGKNY